MRKKITLFTLVLSCLWLFCGCQGLFPLNEDPVVTNSASDEEDAEENPNQNVVSPVEVPEGVTMYCSSAVNVRSLPGMDGDVIGSLEYGEKVTVTGKENGWYEITYDGGKGYVYKDYLTDDSQEE
ncbi:MAG: SH3 domain-containing protein [Ruminococcus sp.]